METTNRNAGESFISPRPMYISSDAKVTERFTRLSAGEILRLAGERAEHLHPQVRAALGEGIAEWDTGDGLVAPASTWIVTARVPS